ncbi:hypothetical protein GGX14DRAFT_569178 [Mycena pura]|uniref:Uncharacterized protein n=1 Tax=Mycena pura TaxID=153505 RepID=A0AAD6V7I6_9AGAR|nr:hypothetical protein GGX14DRAFT_569178 [Mycena pura]
METRLRVVRFGGVVYLLEACGRSLQSEENGRRRDPELLTYNTMFNSGHKNTWCQAELDEYVTDHPIDKTGLDDAVFLRAHAERLIQ